VWSRTGCPGHDHTRRAAIGGGGTARELDRGGSSSMRLAPRRPFPPGRATVSVRMLARSKVFLDFPLNEQVKWLSLRGRARRRGAGQCGSASGIANV
jgi:hypothetical protein